MEFILFTNNHSLQFIKNQPKLSQRHAKCVEFKKKKNVTKHTIGYSNKVSETLSRINLILKEFYFHLTGFDELREMYENVVDFREACATCKNLASTNTTKWSNYMI